MSDDDAPDLAATASGQVPPADLPDDALVVRGGVMGDIDWMIEQAELAAMDGEGYVLSTFAGSIAPGQTADDKLSQIVTEARIPNGKVRVTTAGRLRAEGFTLRQTGTPACHYDVDLGDEPSQDVIKRFIEAFDPPRRNPCPIPRS